MIVHVLSDSPTKTNALETILAPSFTVNNLSTLKGRATFSDGDKIVVDADLRRIDCIAAIRHAFLTANAPHTRVFVVDRHSRTCTAQAFALGATDIMFRPLNPSSLIRTLFNNSAAPNRSDSGPAGAAASAAAFRRMFSSVLAGESIDLTDAAAATDWTIASITASGLTSWLDDVRRHHEGTFQHCLLVTGAAVDFGLSLGFKADDLKQLGVAASLHDVGKGSIPVAILDKPGALDADERKVIETHPAIGYDAVKKLPGVSADVLHAIRHHHEYLDGSGYPDGLAAGQIGDHTRILTIADIFAALIEQRSYKPPKSRKHAYDILRSMTGKLERPLIDAFEPVALRR